MLIYDDTHKQYGQAHRGFELVQAKPTQVGVSSCAAGGLGSVKCLLLHSQLAKKKGKGNLLPNRCYMDACFIHVGKLVLLGLKTND
jgi:hypothetical protein